MWESRWHRKHPRRHAVRLDLVGAPCIGVVARRPVRHRVGLLRRRIVSAVRHHGRDERRRPHLFHRFHLLHDAPRFSSTTKRPRRRRTWSGASRRGFRSLFRVQHHRIDWWASLIQFAGTLWFNRTTFAALVVGLGASGDHHQIWRPDALGSVCFLVASWLAWAEECHGSFAWRPSQISWWITLLNLVGSVAFGVSAIASYAKPNGQLVELGPDQPRDVRRRAVLPGRRDPAPARADDGESGGGAGTRLRGLRWSRPEL